MYFGENTRRSLGVFSLDFDDDSPVTPTRTFRVPKPDKNRHAAGVPSLYTCFRTGCAGVMNVVPDLPLIHGDSASCSECGTAEAYCAVCNGFFQSTRVVCVKKGAGFKYARNGQHSLDHEPRQRAGGRALMYAAVPSHKQRPGRAVRTPKE
jgi:hypothetical protein